MMTRHPSIKTCSQFPVLIFLILFAAPAFGFDFSPLPVVFSENMIGETTSPSTPEVDLLGTNGLELTDATFTGTAAHLMVNFSSTFNSTGSFTLLDMEGVSTHGSDHGFRAEFNNLVFSGTVEGTANLFIGVSLPSVGTGTAIQIAAAVFATTSLSNGNFLTLYMQQDNPDDLANPFGTSSVDLSTADANAIISGAAVRLDLLIDDSSGTAYFEIEIDGMPGSISSQLPLVNYGNQTLGSAVYGQTTFFISGNPIIDVDLTLAEAYANVQPLSFDPLFNIDISAASGIPGVVPFFPPQTEYAAAGGLGLWDSIFALGSKTLSDVSGNATGVTATLSSEAIDDFGLVLPELQALLADSSYDCNDPDIWSLDFTGLQDGIYKIIVYAPSDISRETGDISIDGTVAIASLPGISPAALVEGTSWASTMAVVSGGTLSIDGLGTGAVQCAGLAGIQLEFGSPIITAPPVPSFGVPATLGLVGALLLAGLRTRRIPQANASPATAKPVLEKTHGMSRG